MPVFNYQYIIMETLFLIGFILAAGGIGLVLGQLVWTVVVNCRILEDLVQHKKLRYAYELNILKGLTDMTVFCRFIRDDGHPFMFEIVYRNLLAFEKRLRIIGMSLEITGGVLIMALLLQINSKASPLYMLVSVFGAWIAAYGVNFVLAFVVSLWANPLYRRKIRQNA